MLYIGSMRRVVYQALLKAPVKVVTASGGVIGFIGSVWPDKVKAVIGEGIPVQPISIALLAAAVLYFLLLWLLKPGERDEPSNGGTTITTGGPNSPGFGHVGGNVTQHFHAAPAPTQERKSPYGSAKPASQQAEEYLARITRAAEGYPAGLATFRTEPRCPETPIWKALKEVASRISDADDGAPKARQQLRQAAAEGRVQIWGQQDIPPQHMQDNRHKQIWTPIEADYWHDYELNLLSTHEEDDDKWHTEEEELPGRRGNRYWTLRVDLDDINRRFPKPPKPTPPKPDLGPHGWMAR
jgi:hypothetical protein